VVGKFDGGMIRSDGGGLLLAEVEARTGILARLGEQFTDHRDPEAIEHSVRELVAQGVVGLALGYEDLNDHHRLRLDPLLAVGKADPSGQDRLLAPDKGKPLASSSTFNRLELTPADANAKARYKKIVANPEGLDRLLVDCFLGAHAQPPEAIWIDLDATDDPIHGQQEGRFFHGYYGCYCYLPLYIFCGEHLLCARLRKSDIDACAGSVEELQRIILQIRRRWPETRIGIRGDSGFCREAIMAWCEAHGVEFVLGLAKNTRLLAASLYARVQAQIDFLDSAEPSRVFCEFNYQTLDTWSRERRVVAKAEHPRFVVTSLSAEEANARTLYEEPLLCPRGDGEPHQGATARAFRRSHLHPDAACQPDPPVLLLLRLRAALRPAPPGATRHRAGPCSMRQHPREAEDRCPDPPERASHLGLLLRELSLRGAVQPNPGQPAPPAAGPHHGLSPARGALRRTLPAADGIRQDADGRIGPIFTTSALQGDYWRSPSPYRLRLHRNQTASHPLDPGDGPDCASSSALTLRARRLVIDAG